MKHTLTIFFLIISNLLVGQIQSTAPFSIGETIEIKSKILNENRVINVYLPNGYKENDSLSYPVIYLLDGSQDEDFIHICGLVQFCSFSWINIIEESIVVGIANVDRKKDFTYPSTMEIDQKEFPMAGHSEKFIKFIGEELQVIITERYRITGTKTLIGQSLGGLLATEILFHHSELFDNYIIISPSLWWDNEILLQQKFDKSLKGKSVYVGVGKEGPTMERVAQSLFLKLNLEKKEEAKIFYHYFEQQSHGDVLHLAVYDAFEKIFEKKELGK